MTTHEAIIENFQPRSTYQNSKGIKTSSEQKGVKTKNTKLSKITSIYLFFKIAGRQNTTDEKLAMRMRGRSHKFLQCQEWLCLCEEGELHPFICNHKHIFGYNKHNM